MRRGSERWARIDSVAVRMRGGFLAAALALLSGVHAAGDRVRLRDVQVGCAEGLVCPPSLGPLLWF